MDTGDERTQWTGADQGASERDQRAARIELVDKEYPSPEERAQVVWEIVQKHAPNLTTWDLVCFCVSFLGWQAENLPWIATAIKHISRLVYTAHYVSAETPIDTGLKRPGRPPQAQPQHTGTNNKPEPPRRFTGLDVEGGGFTGGM